MKVAAYVRVSTETQTTDNQLPSIEGLCKVRGWELVKVYSENASAWSGGRQIELARCIRDAEHNHFETIVVWALDRVSREGPLRILSLIDHLHKKGIKLVLSMNPGRKRPGSSRQFSTQFQAGPLSLKVIESQPIQRPVLHGRGCREKENAVRTQRNENGAG